MSDEPDWRLEPSASPAQIGALAADHARGPLAARLSMLQDPRWLAALADEPNKSVRAYGWRSRGEIVGFAGFLVHPSAVRLSMGELTLFSRPVRHLRSFTAPVVADASSPDDEMRALVALLRRMRSDLAADEVVFLESVLEGTALMALLKRWEAERHEFHVLQNGKLYQHRAALLGDSFDAYLKQLGSGTRADLRSTRRKFIAHVRGDYRTRCFRGPEEVPQFVRDAISISRKTYQYDLLGAGLRDQEPLERKYRMTAELGWFRSYILYVGDQPIAFQAGHLHGDRYHAQEIGYDPAWARQHVGIFLHTEIVTDLAASNTGARWFDFGIGDTGHKQRLSTTTTAGGYFYLIPDTWRGNVFTSSLRMTNAASAAIGNALERIGLRQKVRQALRKLGAAR
jgi:CelD/BcsL family acetyltransferase involved in cellulose biosynthesis